MEPFRYHVFICDQEKPEGVPCCAARGSGKTLEALRKEIAVRGLMDSVQITVCGSLGLCERGPNMVVYPEGPGPPAAVNMPSSCVRSASGSPS